MSGQSGWRSNILLSGRSILAPFESAGALARGGALIFGLSGAGRGRIAPLGAIATFDLPPAPPHPPLRKAPSISATTIPGIDFSSRKSALSLEIHFYGRRAPMQGKASPASPGKALQEACGRTTASGGGSGLPTGRRGSAREIRGGPQWGSRCALHACLHREQKRKPAARPTPRHTRFRRVRRKAGAGVASAWRQPA